MEYHLTNANINYEIFGEGRPMVLMHGFWTDHRQIAGCMEPCFKDHDGWKRIYLDLPGMGKTSGYEQIKNSDEILEAICEFIDGVIPNESFVVGGYSFGAYLARGVLQRKYNQVDGLIQICPIIFANSSDRTTPPEEILLKDAELNLKLTPEERDLFEMFGAIQSQRIWERTSREVLAGFALADEPFLSRLLADGHGLSFDVDESIDQFQKPVLIIVGRQDWVVGYRDAWKLIEQYPRATYVVLDKAGHNLPIEQDSLFNLLVIEWLNRVEECFNQLTWAV